MDKELKTLKDICIKVFDEPSNIVDASVLKAEAVKWVKEYHNCDCLNCGECYAFDKFKQFFNLTEDDLK